MFFLYFKLIISIFQKKFMLFYSYFFNKMDVLILKKIIKITWFLKKKIQ